MNCLIERDPQTKEIVYVAAPNGSKSTLYTKALEYTKGNEEKALDLWAVAYTPEFKEEFGDWEEILAQSATQSELELLGNSRTSLAALSTIYGEDAQKIVNRVISNAATRAGIPIEQYKERISVFVASKSVDSTVSNIVNEGLNPNYINNFEDSIVEEVGDIDEIFLQGSTPLELVKKYTSLDLSTKPESVRRSESYALALTRIPAFRAFVESSTKEISEDQRQETNSIKNELANLYKTGQGNSTRATELKELLNQKKVELLKAEKVETLTPHQINTMIDNHFTNIINDIQLTNKYIIKEFSDSYLRGQIEFHRNLFEEATAQQFEYLLDNKNSIQAQELLKATQEQQRESLLASAMYFLKNATYSYDFRILLMDEVLKYNLKYGQKIRRTDNTVGNHQQLSAAVLPLAQQAYTASDLDIEELVKIGLIDFNPIGLSALEIYTRISKIMGVVDEEMKKSIIKKYTHSKTKDGVWLKFNQSDSQESARDLQVMAMDTHKYGDNKGDWCTGSTVSTASQQLSNGDFYVFVDNNLNSKLAVRYQGSSIGEVRGIDTGQGLLSEDLDTAEDFLKERPEGVKYLSNISFNRLYQKYGGDNAQVNLEDSDIEDMLKYHKAGDGSYNDSSRKKIELARTIRRSKSIIVKYYSKKYNLPEESIIIVTESYNSLQLSKNSNDLVILGIPLESTERSINIDISKDSLPNTLNIKAIINIGYVEFQNDTYINGEDNRVININVGEVIGEPNIKFNRFSSNINLSDEAVIRTIIVNESTVTVSGDPTINRVTLLNNSVFNSSSTKDMIDISLEAGGNCHIPNVKKVNYIKVIGNDTYEALLNLESIEEITYLNIVSGYERNIEFNAPKLRNIISQFDLKESIHNDENHLGDISLNFQELETIGVLEDNTGGRLSINSTNLISVQSMFVSQSRDTKYNKLGKYPFIGTISGGEGLRVDSNITAVFDNLKSVQRVELRRWSILEANNLVKLENATLEPFTKLYIDNVNTMSVVDLGGFNELVSKNLEGVVRLSVGRASVLNLPKLNKVTRLELVESSSKDSVLPSLEHVGELSLITESPKVVFSELFPKLRTVEYIKASRSNEGNALENYKLTEIIVDGIKTIRNIEVNWYTHMILKDVEIIENIELFDISVIEFEGSFMSTSIGNLFLSPESTIKGDSVRDIRRMKIKSTSPSNPIINVPNAHINQVVSVYNNQVRTQIFTYNSNTANRSVTEDIDVLFVSNGKVYKDIGNNSIMESVPLSELPIGIPQDIAVLMERTQKVDDYYKSNTFNQDSRAALVKSAFRSVIILGRNSDVTSPLHEMAHEFEEYLSEEERDSILSWAGHTIWTRETSEMFARGFEKFLYEGKFEGNEMSNLFIRFSRFLHIMIKNAIEYFGGVNELNPEVISIYSSLVSMSKEAVPEQEYSITTEEQSQEVEPSFESVVNFILKRNLENKPLTTQDYVDLSNNTIGINTTSLDGLYTAVRNAFIVNGTFSIKEKNLRDSALFNEAEIQNILNSTEAYKVIQKTVERLLSSYLNGTVDSRLRESIKQTTPNEMFLIQDTSRVVGVGKFKFLNPLEVESTLNDILAGVTNREAFDYQVSRVPYESFKLRYNSDAVFAEEVFNRFSRISVIPVMKDSQGLIRLSNREQALDRLRETLILGVDNSVILNNIDFLRTVDESVWEDNIEDIEKVVRALEQQAINIGIDIVDISSSLPSITKGDFIEFLNELENLSTKALINSVTDEDLQALLDSKSQVMDESTENVKGYYSNNTKARALVKINTVRTEIDLFEKESLLKVQNDIYQKINRSESLESLINSVYLRSLNNPSILPREAYYPTAFTRDGEFSVSKLRDSRNQAAIKQDIDNFLTSKAKSINDYGRSLTTIKEIAAYKYFYGYPVAVENNRSTEIDNLRNFNGDFEYLTTDFIADFNKYILNEKFKKSDIYNEVLQYFEFTPLGIKLSVASDLLRSKVKIFMPDGKMKTSLTQYATLSRDSNLSSLFEANHQEVKDDNSSRLFYINNPSALKLFKGDHYIDNGVLVTTDGRADFIKIKDVNGGERLFEKVSEFASNYMFMELPINTEFEYNIVPEVVFEEVKKEVIDNIRKSMTPAVEDLNENLASDKEIEALRQEFDNCG